MNLSLIFSSLRLRLRSQNSRHPLDSISPRQVAQLGSVTFLIVLGMGCTIAWKYHSRVQSVSDLKARTHLGNTARAQESHSLLQDYQQRYALAQARKTRPVVIETNTTKVLTQVQKQSAAITKPVVPKPKVRILITTHTSTAPIDATVAFSRLRSGRDDQALQWLVKNREKWLASNAWQRFMVDADESNISEMHYQLGVLVSAIGQQERGFGLLRRAYVAQPNVRYGQAYAVMADHLGNHVLAESLYRQGNALSQHVLSAARGKQYGL